MQHSSRADTTIADGTLFSLTLLASLMFRISLYLSYRNLIDDARNPLPLLLRCVIADASINQSIDQSTIKISETSCSEDQEAILQATT